MGVPVLLYRCLVVRAFNQKKRKPELVSSSARGAKSPGKCPLHPCWLPSNEGDEVFEPLGLGWPSFLGTSLEKGRFLHVAHLKKKKHFVWDLTLLLSAGDVEMPIRSWLLLGLGSRVGANTTLGHS